MEENQSLLDLEVDNEASANLMEVSRWSKFLGTIVLVGIGVIALVFAFLWNKIGALISSADDMPDGAENVAKVMIVIVLLIVGTIVAVLMSFLLKGANRIRYGIANKDQVMFNSGLANLKNFFVMSGILGIIQIFFALIGLISR